MNQRELIDLANELLHQLWHAIEDEDNFNKSVAKKAYDEARKKLEEFDAQ